MHMLVTGFSAFGTTRRPHASGNAAADAEPLNASRSSVVCLIGVYAVAGICVLLICMRVMRASGSANELEKEGVEVREQERCADERKDWLEEDTNKTVSSSAKNKGKKAKPAKFSCYKIISTVNDNTILKSIAGNGPSSPSVLPPRFSPYSLFLCPCSHMESPQSTSAQYTSIPANLLCVVSPFQLWALKGILF